MFGTTRTLPRLGHLTKLSDLARRPLVREVINNPTVSLTALQKSSAEMAEPTPQISRKEKGPVQKIGKPVSSYFVATPRATITACKRLL